MKDGSTEKQDSRIILIDTHNEGSILTRRREVEASKSDDIMFVDTDDWIEKTSIKDLYKESIENNLDIKEQNKSNYFDNDKQTRRINQ